MRRNCRPSPLLLDPRQQGRQDTTTLLGSMPSLATSERSIGRTTSHPRLACRHRCEIHCVFADKMFPTTLWVLEFLIYHITTHRAFCWCRCCTPYRCQQGSTPYRDQEEDAPDGGQGLATGSSLLTGRWGQPAARIFSLSYGNVAADFPWRLVWRSRTFSLKIAGSGDASAVVWEVGPRYQLPLGFAECRYRSKSQRLGRRFFPYRL